jgi:hypothetical protein
MTKARLIGVMPPGAALALAAAIAVAVVACSQSPTAPPSAPRTTAPIESVAIPTLPPSAAPSAIASAPAPTTAAIGPCAASQLRFTPGHTGAAAGTAYMEVSVDLVQGPDCTMPQGPPISIVAADGKVIANDTDRDRAPLTIHGPTSYSIGWNIGCDSPVPTGRLSARIWLSATVAVDMPIGAFGPSCVDGSTGALFMRADAP